MLPETKLSIDTAVESVAYILYGKMMTLNALPDNAPEKALLKSEIELLQKERNIIYGRGTDEEYVSVMDKVDTVYSPMIKEAIKNDTSIGRISV